MMTDPTKLIKNKMNKFPRQIFLHLSTDAYRQYARRAMADVQKKVSEEVVSSLETLIRRGVSYIQRCRVYLQLNLNTLVILT